MQFEDAPPKQRVGKLEGWSSVSTFMAAWRNTFPLESMSKASLPLLAEVAVELLGKVLDGLRWKTLPYNHSHVCTVADLLYDELLEGSC